MSTFDHKLKLGVNFPFQVFFSANLNHFRTQNREKASEAVVFEHDFDHFFAEFPGGEGGQGDGHEIVFEFADLGVGFFDFEDFFYHFIPDLEFLVEVHDHTTDGGFGVGEFAFDDDVVEVFAEDELAGFAVEGWG
jgi:hypothetical protein